MANSSRPPPPPPQPLDRDWERELDLHEKHRDDSPPRGWDEEDEYFDPLDVADDPAIGERARRYLRVHRGTVERALEMRSWLLTAAAQLAGTPGYDDATFADDDDLAGEIERIYSAYRRVPVQRVTVRELRRLFCYGLEEARCLTADDENRMLRPVVLIERVDQDAARKLSVSVVSRAIDAWDRIIHRRHAGRARRGELRREELWDDLAAIINEAWGGDVGGDHLRVEFQRWLRNDRKFKKSIETVVPLRLGLL